MAHLVETMAYFGETPWHGLGKIIDETENRDIIKCIEKAGLNWNVSTRPIYTKVNDIELQSKQYKAMVRDSDNTILGVVGNTYKPLQNEKAFEWFKPFLESGDAQINAAGSLDNGRKVWVLAKLNLPATRIVNDDLVDKYLLLAHGHDGKLSIRCGFTPIRVVCNNTLTYSINDGRSQLIRIRHTNKMEETLDALRKAVNIADNKFQASQELFQFLASKSVNKNDIKKFVKMTYYPEVIDFNVLSDRKKNNLHVMENNITRLFENGRGNDLPGTKGTFWALYNASNEYLNYEASRTQDKRLDSLWFGGNARLDARALEICYNLAS